jgi:hypothetical protein
MHGGGAGMGWPLVLAATRAQRGVNFSSPARGRARRIQERGRACRPCSLRPSPACCGRGALQWFPELLFPLLSPVLAPVATEEQGSLALVMGSGGGRTANLWPWSGRARAMEDLMVVELLSAALVLLELGEEGWRGGGTGGGGRRGDVESRCRGSAMGVAAHFPSILTPGVRSLGVTVARRAVGPSPPGGGPPSPQISREWERPSFFRGLPSRPLQVFLLGRTTGHDSGIYPVPNADGLKRAGF